MNDLNEKDDYGIEAMSDELKKAAGGDSLESVSGGGGENFQEQDFLEEELPESILGIAPQDEVTDYEDFAMPENMEMDKKLLGLATGRFKKLNLSQKQAQGLIDMSPEITESIRNAQQKEWDRTTAIWAKEVKSDRDIGGSNYSASIAKAERALKKFDIDGNLSEFLISTKAGNNPAMIKFLVNIDNLTSEDGMEIGRVAEKPRELTDSEIFFPG